MVSDIAAATARVDTATDRFMAGMAAKLSSRDAAVYPAVTLVPKGFTIRVRATKPRETRDC